MKPKVHSILTLALTIAVLILTSRNLPADTGTCSGALTALPFTDVGSSVFFCQIAEAYFSGLTNGTTSTTYSPSDVVSRDQMAAFVSRTQDSALKRGSRKAALGRWGFPSQVRLHLGQGVVGAGAREVKSDGVDLWVASETAGTVTRVRASDGVSLGTWTGAPGAYGVLVGDEGAIWVTGHTSAGNGTLYVIDPALPPGAANPVATLGSFPYDIAYDGRYIWTANAGGSVTKFGGATTTQMTAGFYAPFGIVYDGANLWVTDDGDDKLKKLDSSGFGIPLIGVSVGSTPRFPLFDGSNIWVPNFFSNSITVVRARDGVVLATLTGNGLDHPNQAAFDGQFILVTNYNGHSVSLWKAADLSPVGSFTTELNAIPYGACSDGIRFWIAIDSGTLGRF